MYKIATMNHSSRLSKSELQPSNLVELLSWRSYFRPDRKAFTFLEDGETQEVHITYEELDRQARALGALLQSFAKPGERALLLYPPGLEYITGFFGCLYAGVVAVPAYPPDPLRLERTLPRLQTILADSQATVVLTTTPILSLAEFLFNQAPDLGALQWMATDTVAKGAEYGWKEPALTRDSLAFLQYTSGSTSTPRGVMVSHGNLLHNSSIISRAFEVKPDDLGVIWLPPYHDMGLIGGILQPLYSGIRCVLMSPLSFLQRPARWLQAVSRYKGTLSGGPNFAYELCARKITPDQRESLDLSHWEVAFNGAEPIYPETMKRFAEVFSPCGFRETAFYPCYGLAEATLLVSGGRRFENPQLHTLSGAALERNEVVATSNHGDDAMTMVGCGQNQLGQKILIVDPDTLNECIPGKIGEIWVTGPSIAQGYWGRSEETGYYFQARLNGTGERCFLRTGDLGYMLDGELFVTGRIKDLIIIDGLNHYPQDIERTMETCHPAIRSGCTAAFSVKIGGIEQLVAAAEVRGSSKSSNSSGPQQSLNPEDVIREIRGAIAAKHDLRVHDVVLLKARSIPKTSSGKIQRHACRAGYLEGTLEVWGNGV